MFLSLFLIAVTRMRWFSVVTHFDVLYIGDCRPSDRLVEIGSVADLLIREATFEDGM